jgi:hypothetical protein
MAFSFSIGRLIGSIISLALGAVCYLVIQPKSLKEKKSFPFGDKKVRLKPETEK